MSDNHIVNVKVTIRETKGDINRMIRKFMKKVKKERIIENYLETRSYEKPSARRRREKSKKVCNARKAEQERNTKLNIK